MKHVTKILITLALALTFVAMPVYAETTDVGASGIIPSNIWYSKSDFKEGDTIRIYTAVFNNSPDKLVAMVEFYDKTTLLSKKEVTVAQDTLKDVSILWTVTAGDHSISAKIANSTFVNKQGKTNTVVLDDRETIVKDTFVSKDIPAVDATKASDALKTSVLVQADKAGDFISSYTPESIKEPVVSASVSLDAWRERSGTTFESLKVASQKKLDALNSTPTTGDSSKDTTQKESSLNTTSVKGVSEKNNLQKPFEYVKLFSFSALSFIWKTAFVFYGLIAILVFFALRYFYRRIFHRDE